MDERAVIVFFSPVTATSMTSPYVDSDSSTSWMGETGGYIYKVIQSCTRSLQGCEKLLQGCI